MTTPIRNFRQQLDEGRAPALPSSRARAPVDGLGSRRRRARSYPGRMDRPTRFEQHRWLGHKRTQLVSDPDDG